MKTEVGNIFLVASGNNQTHKTEHWGSDQAFFHCYKHLKSSTGLLWIDVENVWWLNEPMDLSAYAQRCLRLAIESNSESNSHDPVWSEYI